MPYLNLKKSKDEPEDAQALKIATENLKKALEEIAKLATSDPFLKRSAKTRLFSSGGK